MIFLSSNFVYAAEQLSNNEVYTGFFFSLALMYLGNRFSNRKPSLKKELNINSNDVKWLSKGINGEARGEPLKGQIAVGAVILNRVKSSDFPNNVYDVLFQSGQFCVVDDGQIHLEPTKSSLKAAQKALEGVDPSKGALFFYNPKTSSENGIAWFSTRKPTIQIGNHVFAN